MGDGTACRLKKLTTRSPVMLFMKGDPQTPRCGFSKAIVQILDETGSVHSCHRVMWRFTSACRCRFFIHGGNHPSRRSNPQENLEMCILCWKNARMYPHIFAMADLKCHTFTCGLTVSCCCFLYCLDPSVSLKLSPLWCFAA